MSEICKHCRERLNDKFEKYGEVFCCENCAEDWWDKELRRLFEEDERNNNN